MVRCLGVSGLKVFITVSTVSGLSVVLEVFEFRV